MTNVSVGYIYACILIYIYMDLYTCIHIRLYVCVDSIPNGRCTKYMNVSNRKLKNNHPPSLIVVLFVTVTNNLRCLLHKTNFILMF